MIEELDSIHESVRSALHALGLISMGVHSLIVRGVPDSEVDEFGFGSGSGPKWYQQESELVRQQLCRLESHASKAARALIEYRPVFLRANAEFARHHGTDPIVRLGEATATNWHQACTNYLSWFEFELDSACGKECVREPWRDLLNHKDCPMCFKTINMLRAVARAVNWAEFTNDRSAEWTSRLDFEIVEARGIASDPVYWEDEEEVGSASQNPAAATNVDATTLDETAKDEGGKSPAVIAVRGAYEWALSIIPGADAMTIPQLFDAIQQHPDMNSEFLEKLPDNANTFGKYLKRAGIDRYNSSGSRTRRPSRRPRS